MTAHAHPVPDSRWATFDCYGTLVDWNAGIQAELARLFGAEHAARLLMRCHESEPSVESENPQARYRGVMAALLAELAAKPVVSWHRRPRMPLDPPCPPGRCFRKCLGSSPEARRRGWQLITLSNSDRDLIDASIAVIGVPFSAAIVASEVASHKPALGHWRAFSDTTHADHERHVHVAQSHFHDIVPAYELGLRSVWINRLGERAQPTPTRELPDLDGLADVLDELVPQTHQGSVSPPC